MNKLLRRPILLTTILAGLAANTPQAAVFFSDDFTSGSTVNSATPADPTATSTAYQLIASKAYVPNPPTLTANDLKFGIANSTSGAFEIQALFATNAVALVQAGDFIQLTIVFTNSSGLLTEAGQLGFGLYNSGQVKPLAGGLTPATTSTAGVSGGAQAWQGYTAQINQGTANSRIMTRPAQSAVTTGNNQDLITSGSSSTSYTGATTVGSTMPSPSLTLVAGNTYTEVFVITLNDTSTLGITNFLYDGPTATGTPVSQFGGVAANTTFLTGGFDAFAAGYFDRAAPSANLMDISSVSVTGAVTVISGPPTITSQPIPVTVPNGGSCAFDVGANGFNVTYQWYRNGVALTNGGNISGATSSRLIISPAGAGDVFSSANGYYVKVTGAGPYSTNSITNSLAFVSAKNLIYTGSGAWDLNTSASWWDNTLSSTFTFNYGDSVTFDDNGGGGIVSLSGSYLSAASVKVSHTSGFYTLQGTGSFAGPGSLIYNGSAQLTINNANTYTGGTIISNATANLRLQNLNGLGTGPVTLAKAGGQLEIMTASSAATGLSSDFVVADDFTIVVDPVDTSYALVVNGDLSGTSGKTLTINHGSNGSGTNVTRIRAAGASTVYDANLNLSDPTFLWAFYGSSQTYNGVISGPGSLMQKGATTYLNGPNTFSGNVNLSAGAIGLGIDSTGSPNAVTSGPLGTSPLLLTVDSTTSSTGTGQLFASGGSRTIGNTIQYPSGTNNLTLMIGGTNDLTFSGQFLLNGNDNVTTAAITMRTIQVTNMAATTFSGVISDGGLTYGLVKTGPGSLYLNGANTYTGPTTNSAGLLAGAGSLAGSVIVQSGAAIGGGSAAAIGTLTINGGLTLNGNGFFRVNRSGLTSDKVSVSGALANAGTGTITVTNLGAALAVGDKFTLFSKPVANGDALTVTGGGAAVNWANNLASDGSITVASVTSTTPPVLTNSVSGGVLYFAWPADHLGWTLQAQTNSVGTGLGTNWVTIPGTASVTSTNYPVNPANGSVFYRLIYNP